MKVRNKIKHRQKVQDREISDTLVSERLKSYPRVSEISLSYTFAGVRFYMSPFVPGLVGWFCGA
jgi:hypothetical protein